MKTKKTRRGGFDTVTTFLFVAIVAVLVLLVVFGAVFPRVREGIGELFRQHGERNVIAYQAVTEGCKIWWKTGNLLDVNMPDGLPTDFDNAGLNRDVAGKALDIAYCNKAKVAERPSNLGKDDAAIERELHLECIDKCTAILELHEACGEQVYAPRSDCYRAGDFTMSLRADWADKPRAVRCVVEGC